MSHYNLVHKVIPMPRTMKIPDAEAAVDKEWKKFEKIPAWYVGKVKSRKEAILEAQKESPLCHTDGHLSPHKCGVGIQITEVSKQSRGSGRHCKRRIWILCSFY